MLTLSGIRKTFHPGTVNEVRALQGVDLTIEDGSLVVTGNYLKLRIEEGVPRNQWVQVLVVSEDRGKMLSRGAPVAFDDQLSAGCANIAAAALAD